MQLGNSRKGYGWVAIILHWLIALAVFGLFGLGWYMVDLSYYDDWYRTAPDIHRSVGLMLAAVVVVRVVWRLCNPRPERLAGHSRFEVWAAYGAHLTLYVLMFVAIVSGYLISTADGSSVQVFNWFTVPSATGRVRELETIVGDIHYWSTWALVGLAGVHALASLKHHFIDRDRTLRRMLKPD